METGWLIEVDDDGQGEPRYLTVIDGLLTWTEDVEQAIRFCRFVDAQRITLCVGGGVRIFEHRWCEMPPANCPKVRERIERRLPAEAVGKLPSER